MKTPLKFNLTGFAVGKTSALLLATCKRGQDACSHQDNLLGIRCCTEQKGLEHEATELVRLSRSTKNKHRIIMMMVNCFITKKSVMYLDFKLAWQTSELEILFFPRARGCTSRYTLAPRLKK